MTAAEWLYNNLKSHFEHDGDLLEVVQFSFEQAKEMEENLAEQFAEFSILCDRRGWTPRTFNDWVEQFKNK